MAERDKVDKAKKPRGKNSSESSSSALVICRNKHWRFISSYHGAWLQLPIEILQIICNLTYNAPAPQPVDAAVLFDILKIRRLVDEATTLAVRAAGEDSPFGQPGGRLSRERKLRIREQACNRLSQAYRLDEIACSVAMMQGSATLEDVAAQVLQRGSKSVDARYVHFFHEKIPSRQLAQSTTLAPLTHVLEADGHAAEVLRTSATVRVFKDDLVGALRDLTEALAQWRHRTLHQPAPTLLEGERHRRAPDAPVPESAQPDSLQGQLLFNRGSVYLTMACRNVALGFSANETTTPLTSPPDGQQPLDAASRQTPMEAQQLVKTLAKHAMRDFMLFIDRFQYSPDWPIKASEDFTRHVDAASFGYKIPRTSSLEAAAMQPITNRLYSLAKLFAAVPPDGLPLFYAPSPQDQQCGVTTAMTASTTDQPTAVCETVTFHPLLTEALHALLLCHCLLQTSAKEIQRHAYMVARLVRLCDGYPAFQSCRSPSREDWAEITRLPASETGLLPLAAVWDHLCAPHLPGGLLSQRGGGGPAGDGDGAAAATSDSRKAAAPTSSSRSDLVTSGGNNNNNNNSSSSSSSHNNSNSALTRPGCRLPQRHTTELMRDYPLTTERARAVAQWLREAPVVASVTRRRKGKKANTTSQSQSQSQQNQKQNQKQNQSQSQRADIVTGGNAETLVSSMSELLSKPNNNVNNNVF